MARRMLQYEVRQKDGRIIRVRATDDIGLFRKLERPRTATLPPEIVSVRCVDQSREIAPQSLKWFIDLFNRANHFAQYGAMVGLR